MIVFFSSCELVEFHYHLFLQTLLSRLRAPAPGQSPSASPQLAFLRLHGNMAQEVSAWPTAGCRLGGPAGGRGRGPVVLLALAPEAHSFHLRALPAQLGPRLPQPAVTATECH